LLDQKETKNQDKPDPSGRFVRPSRTWAQTVLVATVLVMTFPAALQVCSHRKK